jgi:superfamily II DNA helicase RecQ
MVDQVKALNDKGVTAALISSGNGEKINREIFEKLLGRSQSNAKEKRQLKINEQELKQITLLYVTPEQVQTSRLRDAMGELYKKKQLTLFAVDEAHW